MSTTELPSTPTIEVLLERTRAGDESAREDLLALLYRDLKGLARRQRKRTAAPDTINTTALVHEAYLKLANANGEYADRQHFFRVAAQAMRQVLIDYAVRRTAAKRGGGVRAVTLDPESELSLLHKAEHVLMIDEALKRLAQLSPRQVQVVELRYFAGFSISETAEIMNLSDATVSRDWTAARAWLQRELST